MFRAKNKYPIQFIIFYLNFFQMSQGRRTSSLKASYAAVSQGVNKDLNLGSVAPVPSPLPAEPPKLPRNKKYVPLGDDCE